MEKAYSNREIDRFFKGLNERFDSQDKTLQDILAQAKATNGRVNELEKWRTGIIMCLAVFLVIVLPLGIYALRTANESLKNEILKEVTTGMA